MRGRKKPLSPAEYANVKKDIRLQQNVDNIKGREYERVRREAGRREEPRNSSVSSVIDQNGA